MRGPQQRRVPGRSRLKAILLDPVARRLITNSGWLLGADGLVVVLGVAQGALTARLLGVHGYGVLGVVASPVTLINRLTSSRIDEVVVRFLSSARARNRLDEAAACVKAAMMAEAGSRLLAFGLVFVLAPLVSIAVLHGRGSPSLIRLYGLILLAALVDESATGVLQVLDGFRAQAQLTLLKQVAILIGILIAFATHGGLGAVMAAYACGSALGSISRAATVCARAHEILGRRWWRTPLSALGVGRGRQMLRFGLRTNASGTLSMLVKDSDLLVLSAFSPAAEVGYFRLAQSLAGLSMLPAAPLTRAFAPEIARDIAQEHHGQAGGLIRRASWIGACVVLIAAAGAAAISPFVVPVLYGRAFVPAIPALWVMLVGLGFGAATFWTRPSLLALDRPDIPLRIAAVQIAIKLVLVIVFVPRGGYLAMAGILSLLYLMGGAVSMRAVRRELRMRSKRDAP